MRQETVAISTFQTYPAAARQFKQVRCVVLLIELRTSTYSDILLIDLLSYSLCGDQLTGSDPLTSHHNDTSDYRIGCSSKLPLDYHRCSKHVAACLIVGDYSTLSKSFLHFFQVCALERASAQCVTIMQSYLTFRNDRRLLRLIQYRVIGG